MAKILVIEDEPKLANFLLRGLSAEGYDCHWISTSERLFAEVGRDAYELILLDRLVQDIDTLDCLHLVKKKQPQAMILMLTALQGVEQKVSGLQAGADDNLGKPFDFDELLARMGALLRRGAASTEPIADSSAALHLQRGKLLLNIDNHRVWLADHEVELTHLEYQLLKCFLSNPESVLSRERILNKVWGSLADPLTNIVDVYIRRVRKKLLQGCVAQQWDCHTETFIETVRGSGYRLGKCSPQQPDSNVRV